MWSTTVIRWLFFYFNNPRELFMAGAPPPLLAHPQKENPMSPQFRCSAALLLACLLSSVGCQSSDKHYKLTGQVLAKNESAGQASIDNDNIPGFMPAMTMNYPVKDPQGLQQVQPGDRIAADIVVQNGGSVYWLEHVTITDRSARGSVSAATKPHQLLPGEKVPDVPLVNQDGETLHFADLKGKAVLLTFIYTRCPLPTFCPLISSEFAAIHNDLAQTPAIYRKTHLLSVSLDPNYDTRPSCANTAWHI